MDFNTWYASLISDYRWYELLRHYQDSTIKKAGEKVYAQLIADKTETIRPMTENRKHVYNILVRNPGDKVMKPWRVSEQEKKEDEKVEEWKPASPEHVDKCVEEFNKMLASSPMLQRHSGYKQLIEERGWDKKKHAPYPPTTLEEAIARQRHLDWIKANYDARTGKPLPTWVPEKEWK